MSQRRIGGPPEGGAAPGWPGSFLRRVAYVAHLARLRLVGRPAASLVAVAGVALATAAFAATVGGALVVEDSNVGDRFAELPVLERSVQVTHFGVIPGERSYGEVDAAARNVVVALTGRSPARVVELKELRLGADRAQLAAVDDLGRHIRLVDGRLPRVCSPARCELVLVRGQLSPGRLEPPFVIVGRGRLAQQEPVGLFIGADAGTASETLGRREETAVLVGGDPRALSELPALASLYRTYAWLTPLERSDVRVWRVDGLSREVARERNALRAVSGGFEIATPTTSLLEARHAGRVAAGRLRLVGGEAACLLLAFAVFLAATMRRREQAAWRRLTWFGARRWQIVLLATLQVALLAGLGVLAGWLLGLLLTALIAVRADVPAGELVRHALLTRETVAIGAALALATIGALLAALLTSRVRVGGRSFTTFDMAALAAVTALALLLAGGEADGGGSGLLLLVPGLALFVAAYLTARVLAPLTRGLQRLLAGSAVPLRLASLSIARSPGQAVVAVAFLVVSVGLAVFALLYVTTLEHGIDDQAAYRVPHDFLVRERLAPGGLVAPLHVAGIDRYRALAPGTRVVPVIRRSGSVSDVAGANELTVVGLPASELPRLDGWRDDFSSASAGEIAGRLRPGSPPMLRAVAIPADATALVLPVRVTGDDVEVFGAFVGKDGGFVTADLGRTHGSKTVELRVPVHGRLAGARLLGLRFRRVLEVEAHAHGGGPILRGVAQLGPLRAERPGGDRTLVPGYGGWTGVGGARAAPPFGPNAVDYFVSSAAEAFFRLRQPTDDRPLPAAVSPALAALADDRGRLAVQVPNGTLTLRVVATARHFPSVAGPVVAVDRDELAVALHALLPGAGTANELWLDTPSAAAAARVGHALARPPFDVLEVDARAQLRHELETDPLTRGTILLLLAAMATALLLGVLAVYFLAETDARDQSGELLELEVQGAEPRALRRHLRLRLLLVAVPGVVGGTLAGLALSRIVVRFVELTLTAEAPEPPLLLRSDWALLILTPAAFLAAAAAVALLRSRSAFRAAYAGDERR